MSRLFDRADILLPKKDTDMTKYSCIACDQFTSEIDYWNELEKFVGDQKSTLNLTLPEIYLEDDGTYYIRFYIPLESRYEGVWGEVWLPLNQELVELVEKVLDR